MTVAVASDEVINNTITIIIIKFGVFIINVFCKMAVLKKVSDRLKTEAKYSWVQVLW